MHWKIASLTLLFALSLSSFATEPAPTPAESGKALLAAAQREEIGEVKKLLAAGAEVDFKSRYGATALFFAADKGNLALVKLLLSKGADANVVDTFYNTSPLGWATFKSGDSPQHKKVVLLLLEAGGEPASEVLAFGARSGDLDFVKAAVATDTLEAGDLRDALARAQSEDHTAIAEFLAPKVAALPAEEVTEVEEPLEVLEGRVGTYRNEEVGMTIKISLDGETLQAQAEGQDALSLRPEGKGVYGARGMAAVSLKFLGRGGLSEGFVLSQGDHKMTFQRYQPETSPADAKASVVAGQEGGEGESATPAETAIFPPVKRGVAQPWPSFRGANASGIGDGQGIPLTWDGEEGKHLRWKTAIPGIALSSPIVWGDKVFVTSVVSESGDDTFRTGLYGDVDSVEDDSPHRWRVYAINKSSGAILWERLASSGKPKVKRHLKSSHANPTPVTDGKHLVVSFGSEGIFCYDYAGKLLWHQDLGTLSSGWFFDPTYEWGFASSPILFKGKVIVQVDIQEGSFIAAFDVATGKQLWRTARQEIPSWGTPTILPAAQPGGIDEVITNAPTVRGYDVATGRELWTLSPNSEVTVGTPVVADGIAYVTGGYPPARPVYAIKPGGRGDLTLPEGSSSSDTVMWSDARGGTYIPTPIAYQGVLYLLHNNGRLTAYDAKTGELHYRTRVGRGNSFSGSPVAVDGHLLLTTEDGRTYVIVAGTTYEERVINELGEVVMTTPAISDGTLLIRGMDHLYGFGAPDEKAQP
ncbi:MAG: PQQ-binding-like beta-propeller repeat protein [Deltaproteobacteria bacterium]|nr:PQQ-binding-like beta-propeller repeat protein [Deltaproteobacteria bacterium]